jgi:hypothetical protein
MADRTQLPLPDFDQLPESSLTHRIRSLEPAEVERLLDHERAHANRLGIVVLLTRRLEALRAGEAEPSGGDPLGFRPEGAPPPDAGSPGNAAATPLNNQPLRHGQSEQTPNRDIRAR